MLNVLFRGKKNSLNSAFSTLCVFSTFFLIFLLCLAGTSTSLFAQGDGEVAEEGEDFNISLDAFDEEDGGEVAEESAEVATEEDSDAQPVPAKKTQKNKDDKKGKAEKSEKKSGFSIIPGFGTKKTAKPKEKPLPVPDVPHYRIEETIPANALFIARFSTIDAFNQSGKTLLTNLELGVIGPLDWMRFSAYGKSLPYVFQNRSMAVVYVPDGRMPRLMLIVPTNNYRAFIQTLGADVSKLDAVVPDRTVSKLGNPAGFLVYPHKGYAVICEPMSDAAFRDVSTLPSFPEMAKFTASGVKRPEITLEVTPLGIRHFTVLGNTALSDFAPVFSASMKALQLEDPEMAMGEDYFDRANNLVQWVQTNVQSLRLDIDVRETETLLSFALLPAPNSPLAAQIADPFTPLATTSLDAASFLKVVPDYPTALAGQVDLPPDMLAGVQAPFNRIRHVEYGFILPAEQELLAESWCFFLEVDDSEAFVKELIVPKAQMIGSHVASEKGAEIGAEILGNMAVRRQGRQMGRNRIPRNPADPEAAAQRGERLGEMLGGLIGKTAGEKVGMKTQDYMGYKLYTSDLVMVDQQMKAIRAKEVGRAPRKPIYLTGEFTVVKLLSSSIGGLLNGDLNTQFTDKFADGSAPDAPMLASRNFMLALDRHHVLIVPGSETVLRAAVDRWNLIRHLYQPPEPTPDGELPLPPPAPMPQTGSRVQNNVWASQWKAVCDSVVRPEIHRLRSAALLDPSKTQWLADYIRYYYAPQLPAPILAQIPEDTPPLLMVSTTAGGQSFFHIAIDHKTAKNMFQAWQNRQNTR